MANPPQEVIDAIMGPTSRTVRRVEIYEANGVTRWNADTTVRMVDGSVSVDYTRDERRNLDLTLDNSDGALIAAPGGFWYDKIIKVFHGVEIRENARVPSIIIVGGTDEENAVFRAELLSVGYDNVRLNSLANTVADLVGYDIVASIGYDDDFPKAALLQSAYDAGYSVFSQSPKSTNADVPFILGTTTDELQDSWDITPNRSVPSRLTYGWLPESYPGTDGVNVISYDPAAIPVSVNLSLLAAMNPNSAGGKWFHMQLEPVYTDNFGALLGIAFGWLDPLIPISVWETQIGEFMIDRLSEDNFPRQVKITGRDYTKKCETSCFEQSITLTGPEDLEVIIAAIAFNAGITKINLPTTGISVGQTFSFDRGSTRFSGMKAMANAYNFDIFFDGQGYLSMVEFTDPATASPSFTFRTGKKVGNLASYTKTVDDSRLYNHVLVVGDSSDPTIIGPWAEAQNDDPSSPTNIATIGDRLYQYDSSFITTSAQALAVAQSFLAVHSLEEFSLDFSSLVFPWLEVGEIIQWIDPTPAPGDPDMFLLEQLGIPLVLGPMSGSGSRIVIINQTTSSGGGV